MHSSTHRNRLASESSAYLLQHAGNPVDWYPWGSEALELARRLDKPILLSIGYSACHWCHVMERECFENDGIARLMNEHFVCIKVDREERPDVDHLYMKALQGMTGRGGWPMTMFLTPDAQPFFAGTYFPPEDRSGMPGFPRVLAGVFKAWQERHEEVIDSAQRVVSFLAGETSAAGGEAALSFEALLETAQSLTESIDPEHGGFGRAPKFPATMALSLLMDALVAGADAGQRSLVRLSLDRMAAGGIRDHLGGGFHRYSVDQTWLVPHFEKMLYDQALLARLYADGGTFFEDRRFAAVAEEILEYVVREMTAPEGGFYSAQDADSEGTEGKFFTWTPAEIREVLGEERGREFCEAYGVTDEGNFEGQNILRRDPAGVAAGADDTSLAESRELLLRRRSERIPPATDRKIVADWNGLMISAMAGAAALDREDLVDAGARAVEFLRSQMFDDSGLRHMHAGGDARVPAFLDDYAFFGRACLDLFLVRPMREYFELAQLCGQRLIGEFADPEGGGFYFTGTRNEALLARTCDLHDGAVPAGNSVAAELLARLWALTGDEAYRSAAQGVLDRFLDEALRHPYGASHLLCTAERMRRGFQTVVIVGEASARAGLLRVARATYDPRRMAIALEPGEKDWYPSALSGKTGPDSGAYAYICENGTCSLPISTQAELASRLAPMTASRNIP